MSRLPSFLVTASSLFLMGSGALSIGSAVVNLIAVAQLIGPSDEESLGITRNEFFTWYAILFVIGVALVILGWRLRKKKR